MPDRYTKTVLTIIAAALIGLLVQNATGPLHAQSGIQRVQLCGYTGSDMACASMYKPEFSDRVGVFAATLPIR